MTPREIELLLGGYATNTLTEEERRTLFEAALSNQALFDALAGEQALKELLEDPASRAHLLATLGEEHRGVLAWWRRPSVLALAAAVAAAIVVVAVVQPRRIARPALSTVAQQTAPAREIQPPPPAAYDALQSQPKPQPPAKPRSEARQASRQPALGRAAPIPTAAQSSAKAEERGLAVSTAQSKTEVIAAAAPAPAPAPVQKEAASAGARDSAASPPAAGAVNAFTENLQDKQTPKAKAAPAFARRSMGLVGGTAGPPRAPGVRYTIQERLNDGATRDVDPAAPVGIGARIRVVFQPSQEGDLEVLRRESDGSWTPWGSAHVRAGDSLALPAGDFIILAAPGDFHFRVRFGRALQSAKKDLDAAPASGLRRERSGDSVYVVNPAAAPGAGMEFEFTITAR